MICSEESGFNAELVGRSAQVIAVAADLVVDDADSAAQVRPLLPAGPGSRVLVAGRRRLLGLDADLRLTVEPLEPDDAVVLLRDLIGRSRADREPEEAAEPARRCGGLSLALRIASARLQNRPSWTLAFLAGRMSDDVRSLGALHQEQRRLGDRPRPRQVEIGQLLLGVDQG
ncbi:hypothetical protein ABZ943_40630, partial [Streptomyces rubiginosohelvolus]